MQNENQYPEEYKDGFVAPSDFPPARERAVTYDQITALAIYLKNNHKGLTVERQHRRKTDLNWFIC